MSTKLKIRPYEGNDDEIIYRKLVMNGEKELRFMITGDETDFYLTTIFTYKPRDTTIENLKKAINWFRKGKEVRRSYVKKT